MSKKYAIMSGIVPFISIKTLTLTANYVRIIIYLRRKKILMDEEKENKNAISADLIRGHINTIILRTLYERDKYGYEIIEEIESKSHGQYSLKQPTLYSALKRLEMQGYINAYWKTDEISQGGRRKYYTLTDSGREITERNQAEWEYSRTVIDNLISDRSFDFSRPAPNSVDFKILKKSTSRVPVMKLGYDYDEDEDEDDDFDDEVGDVEDNSFDEPVPTNIIEPFIEQAPVEAASAQTVTPVEEIQIEPEPVRIIETVKVEQPAAAAESDGNISDGYDAPPMTAEQRRIVHENYLRLISEPVREAPHEVDEVPVADDIDTEKLIYNNKPETERDYRNLVNRLFIKTIKHNPQAEELPYVKQTARTEVDDLVSKANRDGLKINSADYVVSGSHKKSYNRGSCLFKSSLIISIILLLEFTLCLLFRKELEIGLAYPFVILSVAAAQLLIFGVLCYTDIGKYSRKPSSTLYLSACIIVTIILIFIIFIVSLLLGVNFASAGSILSKIIIPCIISLNIPAFGVCFYFFSK